MAGLSSVEANAKLAQYGPNALPDVKGPSTLRIFLSQFLSPLIYILLAAALVSLALGEVNDAIFIAIVLLINGTIGATQEYSAGRAVAALRRLEEQTASVIRDGVPRMINAREIVPGDRVLLEAGVRVPADLEIVESTDLQCDEALLTGESAPVKKSALAEGEAGDEAAARRRSMSFAGSMITRGRGRGNVSATGSNTEIGKIAKEIGKRSISKPPLMIRMEHFSRMIAIAVGVVAVVLIAVGLMRGMVLVDLFLMSVALAVAAIPEGLPVAISVALAISMRRMAKENVIVRKMPAVESLGSCTMIATDKTGTLTMNELTVTDICLPDGTILSLDAGQDPDASAVHMPFVHGGDARPLAEALLRAAALPNEARLTEDEDGWKGIGDTVDVALLIAARKGGIAQDKAHARYPLAGRIPYEPDLKYAASFHRHEDSIRIFVKGAPETLIEMADRMAMGGTAAPIERKSLLAQKEELAAQGLRVLGFAEGEIASEPDGQYSHRHLVNLTFLGFAGMQDPVRPEVPGAIRDCYSAGIEIAMVTGDDPKTASVIAQHAGLKFTPDQIVTGADISRAEREGDAGLDELTRRARIYARVEPSQKLSIVLSLIRNGHFVAVTGDGVNDAPALKHAHVGVAMGLKGTDVAKESADIIIADDNFASIMKGILEGRVAYANIRKVIFMLVSTGAAEIVLFLLAIPMGLPMPLLPLQLLWLNLVTEGVQDVALAFEKAEGDELVYPPRNPKEAIFDRVMLRRILHSAAVMGVGGFAVYYWLVTNGYDEDRARNLMLLLFVLFENFQTFNSRSEHHSVFRQRFFANPFLVLSIIGAQAIHIAAMYTPGLSDLLQVAPVTLKEWGVFFLISSTILLVMEFEKWWDQRREPL
jgi:Ca2+-transporting ATPase